MYLPKPLPDELLGSAINRGAYMAGNSFKAISRATCGTSKDKSSLLLPAATSRIALMLGISPLEALWNHTMIPYITAYYSSPRKEKLIAALLSDRCSSTRTGPLVKSLMKSLRFRKHCEQCLNEDMSTYGFSYWRRQHCLPGVEFCPSHLTALIQTNVPLLTKTGIRLTKGIFAQPNTNVPNAVETHILHASVAALKTRITDFGDSREHMRHLAAQHGYLLPNKRIFAKKLIADLYDWFPSHYMLAMDCHFRADSTNGWPATILRTTRQVGTQKHIVMDAFFANFKSSGLIKARRSGPAPRDYAATDATIAATLREELKTLPTGSVTATELLCSLGAFGTYRHNRHRLPQTRKIVEELYQLNRSAAVD